MPPRSSILYQNPDSTVLLIDIPQSIANAQHLNTSSQRAECTNRTSCNHDHQSIDTANNDNDEGSWPQIYSTPPLKHPFPSTEPKSQRAKANVARHGMTILESDDDSGERVGDQSSFPVEKLRKALEEVRASTSASREREQGAVGYEGMGQGCSVAEGLGTVWCLPRRVKKFQLNVSAGSKGRKIAERQSAKSLSAVEEPSDRESVAQPAALEDRAASEQEPMLQCPQASTWRCLEPFSLSSATPSNPERPPYKVRDLADRLVYNPLEAPMTIQVRLDDNSEKPKCSTYNIPPHSHFLLSHINQTSISAFSMAAYTHLSGSTASAGPGQFDLVLLDPPWPNRSVRRSRAYEVCKSQDDEDPLNVLSMVLPQHLTCRSLVGCWITNSRASREKALRLFETCAVELIEEWAWLKVTVAGEPVYDIGGIWKKPFEVLLLGRRRDEASQTNDGSPKPSAGPNHRVLIAVPDVHSRKPCLKEQVERMMPHATKYRAVEIFGRSLTSGWWTWGDEVLRHNWEGCWSSDTGP